MKLYICDLCSRNKSEKVYCTRVASRSHALLFRVLVSFFQSPAPASSDWFAPTNHSTRPPLTTPLSRGAAAGCIITLVYGQIPFCFPVLFWLYLFLLGFWFQRCARRTSFVLRKIFALSRYPPTKKKTCVYFFLFLTLRAFRQRRFKLIKLPNFLRLYFGARFRELCSRASVLQLRISSIFLASHCTNMNSFFLNKKHLCLSLKKSAY